MNLSKNSYYKRRRNIFKWRKQQNLANKTVMAFFMACITGIMAQIVFPLPWTPVPITAQTFAVLISGIILGKHWGGISQLFYVFLGLLGVPWFAGMAGGYEIVLGASGGYLIGFILAALFLGHFTDKYIQSRNFKAMLGLMSIAIFGLVYIPGLLILGAWIYTVQGTFPSLWNLLVMGFLPFLLGDCIKIMVAAAFTQAALPKEEF